MKIKNWINKSLSNVVNEMEKSFNTNYGVNSAEELNLATRENVYSLLDEILAALFPGFQTYKPVGTDEINLFIGDRLRSATRKLSAQITQALTYRSRIDNLKSYDIELQTADSTIFVIESLPKIHKQLSEDIKAALNGDPAARSINEVIMSYPFIEAIATYRIANLLYEKNIPIIPRIMTERAHSRTGIDIHPGAKIGPSFFIDHGTGVVIGETSIIGENVKLYQGVTLGALSFPKNSDGEIINNKKRHPTILDNVIIYAGATILGDITIGTSAVIGGNVFITRDVPDNAKISNRPPSFLNEGGLGI